MILTLPVLAIVTLAGLSVVSAAGRAADAGQARDLVAVGGTAAQLAARLQGERAAAALVFAESSSASSLGDYRGQAVATDAAVAALQVGLARTELPDSVEPLMARVNADLAGLAALRLKVMAAPDAVLSVVTFRYRAMVADLISYRQALGQVGVSPSTANGLRSTAALSQAVESLGQLQVAAVRALAGGRLTPAGQQEIVAADTGITEALQTFGDLGPPGWRGLLNSQVGGGPQVLRAERLQSLVTRAQPGTVLDLGTDARGWSAAVGARIELMHGVEADLDTELLEAVTAERDAERNVIVASLGAVAVLLVIVAVVGVIVARSLTGSLSRLQVGAMDVAERRLLRMVRELDVDHADPAVIERLVAVAAEPIAADGSDEVANVADAFNRVTASAVRLASEQAALRAGIGAILVSLSRRLQLRADAMMVSLDGLERNEQDPDRLGKLFALDHIATLFRRLIFNLQVLAGGRGGRVRDAGVPLDDLVRAAGQEIEDYTRVRSGDVDDTVLVRGEVADELIHLLAELVDNAARYSPPSTPVVVEARHVGDQLYIQVRDEGTGMGEADLRAVRDRVAHPRRLDHRVTQQMGLPVVGAIAQRLGVRLEFRSVPGQGTRVDLTVPHGLFSRRQALQAPTAELAMAERSGPPPWPPLPATVERPLIFEQLAGSPARSWFQPTAPSPAAYAPGRHGPGSAAWPEHAPAGAGDTTRSGLPVRDPGHQLIPPSGPTTAASTPVARQPERLRRQMSAFQHGLGLAGRHRAHTYRRTFDDRHA